MSIASSTLDRLTTEFVAALDASRVSSSESVREQHGDSESHHRAVPPDLVVFPETTSEVAQIVRVCSAERVPLIPFGAGTSLEGHLAAVEGGVSIDLSGMNRVLRLNVEDLDVTVEAGVTRKQLERHLRPEGVFFPIDPGADATIGGMVATRATGTTTVRYGGMRENVLSLTVVTARGDVVRTGARARKSSAGYDLTRLYLGSEGTLGVVTEATLRVYGIPEAVAAAVCPFPDVESAVTCAMRTIQSGIPVARIEFLDEVQMDAINRLSDLGYPTLPTLFLEFHGTETGVAEQAEEVSDLAADVGGSEFQWSAEQEDRTRLWDARHRAYDAVLQLRPGSKGFITDVCVPISHLAESVVEARREVDRAGVLGPIVGHVGDGNFHVCFLVDPNDSGELDRVKAINERLVRSAIEVGGTCTGEHGIGLGKKKYLEIEHGPEGVEMMRSIKTALDPHGIMNPGKVV